MPIKGQKDRRRKLPRANKKGKKKRKMVVEKKNKGNQKEGKLEKWGQ